MAWKWFTLEGGAKKEVHACLWRRRGCFTPPMAMPLLVAIKIHLSYWLAQVLVPFKEIRIQSGGSWEAVPSVCWISPMCLFLSCHIIFTMSLISACGHHQGLPCVVKLAVSQDQSTLNHMKGNSRGFQSSGASWNSADELLSSASRRHIFVQPVYTKGLFFVLWMMAALFGWGWGSTYLWSSYLCKQHKVCSFVYWLYLAPSKCFFFFWPLFTSP